MLQNRCMYIVLILLMAIILNHQSIIQSINQSTNQSTNQPIKQSNNTPVSRYTHVLFMCILNYIKLHKPANFDCVYTYIYTYIHTSTYIYIWAYPRPQKQATYSPSTHKRLSFCALGVHVGLILQALHGPTAFDFRFLTAPAKQRITSREKEAR